MVGTATAVGAVVNITRAIKVSHGRLWTRLASNHNFDQGQVPSTKVDIPSSNILSWLIAVTIMCRLTGRSEIQTDIAT